MCDESTGIGCRETQETPSHTGSGYTVNYSNPRNLEIRRILIQLISNVQLNSLQTWLSAWGPIRRFIRTLNDDECLALRGMLGEIGTTPDEELSRVVTDHLYRLWRSRVLDWLRERTAEFRRINASINDEQRVETEWEEITEIDEPPETDETSEIVETSISDSQEQGHEQEQPDRTESRPEWVPEYVHPTDQSLNIRVGERVGTQRVYRIHRNGSLDAIDESTLLTHHYRTPFEWYGTRSIATISAPFDWVRDLSQLTVMQYMAGLVEGFGRSIGDFAHAVIRIDQTMRSIYQALSDLEATGNAILQSMRDWKNRFLRGSDAQMARMIGRLVGRLLFEIVSAGIVGRALMLTKAAEVLTALRSGSVEVLRTTSSRLSAASSGLGSSVAVNVTSIVQRLRALNLLRSAATILSRSIEVGRGVLRVAGNSLNGVLYVATDAYYFLIDGSRNVVVSLGRTLDQFPSLRVQQLNCGFPVTEFAGDLYRWLSTRRAPGASGSIASGVRGFARLTPDVQTWLRQTFTGTASSGNLQIDVIRRSLAHAGDDIIEAINTFYRVDGFSEVIRDFSLRTRNHRTGANFVMRFARAELSDRVGHSSIRFEMPSGAGTRLSGMPREVDIFLEGMHYELKSIIRLPRNVIRNQLIPDIVNHLTSDLSRLRNFRWILNRERFPGLNDVQIELRRVQFVREIQNTVRESSLLRGYPRMNELLQTIDQMLVIWPARTVP